MKEKRARHDVLYLASRAVFFDRVTDERDNESAINTLLDDSFSPPLFRSRPDESRIDGIDGFSLDRACRR